MSRPSLIAIAGAAAIVLAVLAAVLVPPLFERTPAIETAVVGAWRETDSPQACRLTVSRDPRTTEGVWYTVTYPRSFKVPFPASLDGKRVAIWGENTWSAPVWYLTYDAGSDTLTATRPGGGERHTFRREPEAPGTG